MQMNSRRRRRGGGGVAMATVWGPWPWYMATRFGTWRYEATKFYLNFFFLNFISIELSFDVINFSFWAKQPAVSLISIDGAILSSFSLSTRLSSKSNSLKMAKSQVSGRQVMAAVTGANRNRPELPPPRNFNRSAHHTQPSRPTLYFPKHVETCTVILQFNSFNLNHFKWFWQSDIS